MKECVDEFIVSADRNALIAVVEVVVVENHANRQPLDDESRQLRTFPSPLLFGVAFDELFVNVVTNQHLCLLFKIARFGCSFALHLGHCFCLLLVQFGKRLVGSGNAPHLIKGVHVERQVIQLALIISHGRIGVAVEWNDGVDEVPHLFI